VVTGHEIESSRLRVLEAREEDISQLARQRELVRTEFALDHLEQGVEQKRIVVEIGVEMGVPVLVGGHEPAIAP